MGNQLYESMKAQQPQGQDIASRFAQFRQSFQGDARQQVQNLLNSGRISQAQYNSAVQKANALKNMLGM